MPKLITRNLIMAIAVITALAQSRTEPKQFDLASIKPSAANDSNFAVRGLPGGTLICTGVTLKMLIMNAYNVKAFQILGGPSWVGETRWDLEARVEGVHGKLSFEQHQTMLRQLLEDRFRLRSRREIKETSVFALVVGRKGPKLTPHIGGSIPFGQRRRMGLARISHKPVVVEPNAAPESVFHRA